MTLGQVIAFLEKAGYPIGSILFTADSMRGWYRPLVFSPSRGVLACRAVDRDTTFDWEWCSEWSIKNRFSVEKIRVDFFEGNRSKIIQEKLIFVHLTET